MRRVRHVTSDRAGFLIVKSLKTLLHFHYVGASESASFRNYTTIQKFVVWDTTFYIRYQNSTNPKHLFKR